MDSKISQLPRAIISRKCPGCGLQATQLEIERAIFNLKCPRCGKHALSEFQPAMLGRK